MPILRLLWGRLKGRLIHISLAGAAKWGATLGLVAYLRAHGHRPIWGILIGLCVGVVILISAFWPTTPPPPTTPTV